MSGQPLLQISPDLALPLDAVTETFAILAKWPDRRREGLASTVRLRPTYLESGRLDTIGVARRRIVRAGR